jgi:peptide/nickel transport system substrate-binding protein
MAQGAEPRSGGRLTIAVGAAAESMDSYVASAPSSGVIYDNIYDELTVIEPDGTIVPSLATAWEMPDPERWRFTLREGVTWHDGTPFTVEDVKYHFDRVFDPEAPGRPAGLTPGVDHVEIVDDSTFDIVSPEPYPMMTHDLAPRWNVISSNPAAIEEFGDSYGEHPVGTGPFRFVEWIQGESLTLAANDEYWDGRPYLDEVVFRFIPEETTRLLALETGEVDFIYGLPRHEVERLEAEGTYKVLKSTTWVTQYIVFNAAHELFQDVRVRNAIAHAINREQLVAVAFEGQAEVAGQLISPGILGYDPNAESSWNYDLERARTLMAEAGWTPNSSGVLEKDGVPFSVEFSFATGPRYPEGTSELIQSDLLELGLDVQLRQWESAAILTEFPKGSMDFYAYAQGLGSGQFGQLAYVHFHSAGGRNYNFLYQVDPDTTAALDEILDASLSEFDDETRLDLWRQVMEINREQALMIPLYHPIDLGATSQRVMDAYLHPGEYLRVKRVWLSE